MERYAVSQRLFLLLDLIRVQESLPPPSTDSSQTSFSDVLRTILGVAPDLFSCQLAVLCFKPCKEVQFLLETPAEPAEKLIC